MQSGVQFLGSAILAGAMMSMGIVAWSASHREANERAASAALKTLGHAEADFRSNDRDGNVVNDFWTADVAGLHLLKDPERPGAMLRLIDAGIAAADGDFLGGSAYVADTFVPPAEAFGTFRSRSGYQFISAQGDGIADPAFRLDTDADPKFGACHNMDRFAFIAFPRSRGAGRLAFTLNQDNTMYKVHLDEGYGCEVQNVGTTRPTVSRLRGVREKPELNEKRHPVNPCTWGFSKPD